MEFGCRVWEEIMEMVTDPSNGKPIFVASFEVYSHVSLWMEDLQDRKCINYEYM